MINGEIYEKKILKSFVPKVVPQPWMPPCSVCKGGPTQEGYEFLRVPKILDTGNVNTHLMNDVTLYF